MVSGERDGRSERRYRQGMTLPVCVYVCVCVCACVCVCVCVSFVCVAEDRGRA